MSRPRHHKVLQEQLTTGVVEKETVESPISTVAQTPVEQTAAPTSTCAFNPEYAPLWPAILLQAVQIGGVPESYRQPRAITSMWPHYVRLRTQLRHHPHMQVGACANMARWFILAGSGTDIMNITWHQVRGCLEGTRTSL